MMASCLEALVLFYGTAAAEKICNENIFPEAEVMAVMAEALILQHHGGFVFSGVQALGAGL